MVWVDQKSEAHIRAMSHWPWHTSFFLDTKSSYFVWIGDTVFVRICNNPGVEQPPPPSQAVTSQAVTRVGEQSGVAGSDGVGGGEGGQLAHRRKLSG